MLNGNGPKQVKELKYFNDLDILKFRKSIFIPMIVWFYLFLKDNPNVRYIYANIL